MKKFGFSKKSGKSSPAPSDNPYAQAPPAKDPYANEPVRPSAPSSSYSQGSSAGPSNGHRMGLPSGPRGGGYGGGGPPPRPAAAQPPNGNGRPGPGYGPDKLGSGGGYGAARYQNEDSFRQNQNISVAPPSRPGGYGGLGGGDRESVASSQDRFGPGPGGRGAPPRDGPSAGRGGYGGMGRDGPPQNNPYGGKPAGGPLGGPPGGPLARPGNGLGNIGRTPSSSTEVNRGDLFGAAKNRYDPQQGNVYDAATRPAPEDRPNQPGVPAAPSASYDGYGEQRELTEEEKDEQTYRETLGMKKQVKQDSAASVQRSLQTMNGIFEVQSETNARLAEQGERLFNADKNMDVADNYNAVAYNKTKELRTVNRSMFAVHVANPFTAKKRAEARDQEVMDRHRAEKEQREDTRRNQYEAKRMYQDQNREMASYQGQATYQRRAPGSENPYAYEDDEEEQQLEEDIEEGLAQLSRGVDMIKFGAMMTGKTLDEQGATIDRIAGKTDRVDDGVRRNRLELDKVR